MRRILSAALIGFVGLLAATELRADQFSQTNLVSDQPGVAQIQDANLVNAWGISRSGGSPFWVSNNGSGTSTLYNVNGANLVTKVGLVVSIPGDGSVTGQVFNTASGAGAFNKDNFLFVSEDGTISGWRGALGTTAEVLQVGSASNVFKGTALGTLGTHSYLYSANFRNGTIDVLKGDAGAPNLSGSFTDPTLPAGYAPFNVQNINNTIYVTYALQDGAKHDEVDGAGLGFVSKFDLNGNFLGRVASQGTLDAPWGLVIAPAGFGSLGGDLLVGNFGDGRINAYDLGTNTFVGQLNDLSGKPLAIDGLWGLIVGNGGAGGRADQIYFTAGPDGESHGLFGVLAPVPEPSTAVLAAIGLVVGIGVKSRRKKVSA